EPFLPTEVNLTSGITEILRMWETTFHPTAWEMDPVGRKGLVTKFVNRLADDDFTLLLDSIVKRAVTVYENGQIDIFDSFRKTPAFREAIAGNTEEVR